jgi:hypothetical protein
VSDAKRILLFHEGGAEMPAPLRAHLLEEGFEVTSVRSFLEAAPFLAANRTDLFLFYLPEQEWVRNAILTETRRANPRLPIVAMAPSASDELFRFLARFHIASVLPAKGDWRHTIEVVRREIGSSASP